VTMSADQSFPALTTRRLASFVPRLVSERLAAVNPVTEPETRLVPGAVLLTDIAGFTRLVEELTESGPAGLDELAAGLDAYSGALAEQVYAHGGDIVTIAGDAFLCVWPAEDGDLATATLRAVQAGLAVLDAVDREFGHDQRRRFETRVGVGAGNIITAFVGGLAGDWKLIATGEAVDDVASAEEGGTPGRVALSTRAVALVGDRCEYDAPRAAIPLVARVVDAVAPEPTQPRPAAGDDAVRAMIPATVLHRPTALGTAWMAELRQVTVVIAALRGIDHTNTTSLARGHQAALGFQTVVDRFEGFATIRVDNKGVTALGIFGLPPYAHEDDATRAVLTAQELVAELEDLGVDCQAGVATGRAFCGVFGSDLRRDYTVHGNVINLAARLMSAANGGVLVDESTVTATRGSIDFEAVAPLSVKGRSRPVRPSIPTGSRTRVHGRADRVIGRGSERQLLATSIRRAGTADAAPVVFVEGEAGIGKSTLLAEAADDARRDGVVVLNAAGDSLEVSTSYYAWRPIVESLLRSQTLADLLRERVDLARLAPLLADVIPGASTDTELTAQMTGDVRSENTRKLLVAILEQSSALAPTCLVLEDAHWLDTTSWALLLDVARHVPRLGIVVASRPIVAPVPAELTQMLALARSSRVELVGLPDAELEDLIADQLGVAEVPAALTALVLDRVVGNPFFALEIVRSMTESGHVVVRDGRAEIDDLTLVEVPATVEGVILERLNRLSVDEALALKTAAVIGRSFRARTVRDVYPIDGSADEVPRSLARVAELGLTNAEASDEEPWYQFNHEITREVTYRLLTHTQRQPIHLAVVDWYERAFEQLDGYFALLAEHAERGGAPDRAVDYLDLAGRQALRTGAFEEAKRFFTSALDLDETGHGLVPQARRAVWRKSVGTAHYFLGDLTASRADHEEALVALHRPLPRSRPVLTSSLVTEVTRQLANLARPGHRRGRRAQLGRDIDEIVDIYRVLGQIYFLDGEPPPILIYLTLAGLNAGEEAGASSSLARILVNASLVGWVLRLNRLADRYAARAIEMVANDELGDARAYVWSVYAVLRANRGDWEAARTANDVALKQIFEVGDYSLEAEVWLTRGAIEVCTGSFGAAEYAWTNNREIGQRTGNRQMLCWSFLDEAQTCLGRGSTVDAARALEEALAIPTAANDGSTAIEKHATTAVVRFRQGRHDEAADAARRAVAMIADQLPTAFQWPEFGAWGIEVCAAIVSSGSEYGRTHARELLAVADRGVKAMRKIARVFGSMQPRAPFLAGLVADAHGDLESAVAEWEQAARIARERSMPFEEARALLELGTRVDDGRSAHRLRVAAATFEELGATHYLRRARPEEAS
jgi:class 3 adenylate cyclase/tetratricopeptide (TPR) repeat protein